MTRRAPVAAPAQYSLRAIRDLLGLSTYTIRQLIEGGFVRPGRGPRNAYRFEFRDVVLLRVANELRAARIPTRRIMRSLARLRADLPETMPLSGLRIRAVGDQVAVHRRRASWNAESGQLLIDFQQSPVAGGQIAALSGQAESERTQGRPAQDRRAAVPGAAGQHAEDRTAQARARFAEGEAAEADDRSAAERLYRLAIELDPTLTDAMLNLSALLCESGRFRQAIAVLDAGIATRPRAALLHFNRGVALEDFGRPADAAASYAAAIAVEPTLADAHYNLARLCESAGDQRRALRHLSAYRRLTSTS
ncbi:MAG: tetratricopeptide repeat protein [Lautropia sp.]